ncbi:MAG: S-adenosylmethionine:tRNA ribosyltransferase-isomerase [Actinomycetota bacterium]|nr:S-adenosylmethionine:tRNA ribosyltransferase-isomerase [Actinomycetota bacterium]
MNTITLNQDQAEIINGARNKGGRIIAVGTTTTRVLETVMRKHQRITADKGQTSLIFTPVTSLRQLMA